LVRSFAFRPHHLNTWISQGTLTKEVGWFNNWRSSHR